MCMEGERLKVNAKIHLIYHSITLCNSLPVFSYDTIVYILRVFQ